MFMIRKIIEWDKKRKFGHKFWDFILILCLYVVINLFAFIAAGELNLYLLGATAILSVWLWNRKPPCEE